MGKKTYADPDNTPHVTARGFEDGFDVLAAGAGLVGDGPAD